MSNSDYSAPKVTSYGPLTAFTGRTADSTNEDILEGLDPNDNETGLGSTDTVETV